MNCCRICHVCLTSYHFQCRKIVKCKNTECFAFVCNKCLQKWYLDNDNCPICHNTEIEPLEKIINCHNKIADVNQPVLKNKCKCNCHCECNKIPCPIEIILIFVLSWFVGVSVYWLLFILFSDDTLSDKFVKYMNDITFHIEMMFYGFVFEFIIILIDSCCKSLCLMN